MMGMGELYQLEWSRPWWGLLVLLPLVMALLLRLRRTQVLHYAEAHLLGWVMRGSFGQSQSRWLKIMHLAAWLLLACAAAGPRLPLVSEGGAQKQALSRHEMNIMVVLDVSPSMQAQDISPDRLQRAKLELQDWLPRLRGERVGLIAFSGGAGLLMPMSRDDAAFRYYLQLAEPSLFEMPGTAMAAAMELAQRKLMQDKSVSRAVLLVTDGEASALSGSAGVAMLEAAKNLRNAGIQLYILGVGTQAGAPIPVADGGYVEQEGVQVVSRLDQTGFSDLAQLTGGKFARVEDGDGDWSKLYDNGLLTLPGSHRPAENVHAWRELYPWFLFPALVLLFAMNFPAKLKAVKPAALLLFLLLNAPVENIGLPVAYAAETGWQQAYIAFQNRNYVLAQTLYSQLYGYAARMGEGASAYRRKDYLYAVKQYSQALLESRNAKQRAAALFNLGNSLYLAGNDRAAADAYTGVLRLMPDNRGAAANLALVSAKLARQARLDKFSEGILGRRGSQTGGDLDRDITDVPVSIAPSAAEQSPQVQPDGESPDGDGAKIRRNAKQHGGDASSQTADADRFYRAALKKLELVADKPALLQKELIKVDPAHAPAAQGELQPW